MVMKKLDIRSYIRSVPDFPKKGIVFRDITTILKDADAFRATIDEFYEQYRDRQIDAVVGIEARGFIFGAALAYKLGCAFVPVRKPSSSPQRRSGRTINSSMARIALRYMWIASTQAILS